ncbi:hypothetical protein ColLi_09725 [Colletotrichum liriopes]|uniref:Uncharacterized protein n=1 Tax=Colletotrichum liriopes TaxID=708192 RepID=A0AA37GTV3_9PEZI|nr:hypothetical protein ColLi_09725 [Colletotrichum liriopes]
MAGQPALPSHAGAKHVPDGCCEGGGGVPQRYLSYTRCAYVLVVADASTIRCGILRAANQWHRWTNSWDVDRTVHTSLLMTKTGADTTAVEVGTLD